MNPDLLPDHFKQIKNSLKTLQEIENFPKELIHFVSNNPAIDKIIIGTESVEQLRKNFELYFSSISEKKLPTIPTFDDELLMPMKWPKTQ